MSDKPIKRQEYTDFENDVKLVYDVFRGSKYACNYLDQFLREDNSDYNKRKLKANLDNYVFRTCDSIKNIIFRKPISTDNVTNNELKTWLEEDIDLNGNDINEFSKKVLVNAVRDGKSYILVDSPIIPDDVVTKADEADAKVRPYLVNIKRADLINWDMDEFGQYTMVLFNESYVVKSGLFGVEKKVQQKAMFNDGTTIIFRDDKEYLRFEREVKEITLIEVDDKDIPPLLDMAKLNITQMNRMSEQDNYVRIGSCPFPITYGSIETDTPQTLSISQGLRFPNKQEGGFEWAELKGKNYQISESHIKSLIEKMENISISFAVDVNVKTATQVQAEATEDESKLSDYAQKIELAINNAIMYMYLYNPTLKGDNYVSVNKDFASNVLSPEQFNILMQLRLNNELSYELFIQMLMQGEIIPYLDEKQLAAEKLNRLNDGMNVEDNEQ